VQNGKSKKRVKNLEGDQVSVKLKFPLLAWEFLNAQRVFSFVLSFYSTKQSRTRPNVSISLWTPLSLSPLLLTNKTAEDNELGRVRRHMWDTTPHQWLSQLVRKQGKAGIIGTWPNPQPNRAMKSSKLSIPVVCMYKLFSCCLHLKSSLVDFPLLTHWSQLFVG
jgi:hypothetical protein